MLVTRVIVALFAPVLCSSFIHDVSLYLLLEYLPMQSSKQNKWKIDLQQHPLQHSNDGDTKKQEL